MKSLDPNLEKFIKEHYSATDECKRDIDEKIKTHITYRSLIFQELNNILDEYRREDKPKDELYPELDTHKNTQIKDWKSIAKKIMNEPKKYNFNDFHQSMKDILRFRILCNYLSEVIIIKNFLVEKTKDGTPFKLIEDPRNYIEINPKDRERGHRAIHLFFSFSPIIFEVQIMTLLQHGWDKKDHSLRYKQADTPPLDEEIKFFSMSELLYIADEFFDSLRDKILKRRKMEEDNG